MIAAANFVGLPLMFLSAILDPDRAHAGLDPGRSRGSTPSNWGVARRAERASSTGGDWGATQARTPVPARGDGRHVIVRDVVLPRVPALDLVLAALAFPASAGATYGWPLQPFDKQHAVRSFFDDPRAEGTGASSFHFGIDISARDGTPVYAVAPGVVRLQPDAVALVADTGDRTFSYWHVDPVVADGARVAAGDEIGTIKAGFGHVHFTEIHGDRYVNPLRPGGIAPYVDSTSPTVVGALRRGRHAQAAARRPQREGRPARRHLRHAAAAASGAAVEPHACRSGVHPLAADRRGAGERRAGTPPSTSGRSSSRRRHLRRSTRRGRRSTGPRSPRTSSTTSRTRGTRRT